MRRDDRKARMRFHDRSVSPEPGAAGNDAIVDVCEAVHAITH